MDGVYDGRGEERGEGERARGGTQKRGIGHLQKWEGGAVTCDEMMLCPLRASTKKGPAASALDRKSNSDLCMWKTCGGRMRAGGWMQVVRMGQRPWWGVSKLPNSNVSGFWGRPRADNGDRLQPPNPRPTTN